MARQRAQASEGTYPRRGTCTSTGAPVSSAERAVRSAMDGSRAVRAAGSRSSAYPLSSSATTRGVRARTTGRAATMSCAHPPRTNTWASAVLA